MTLFAGQSREQLRAAWRDAWSRRLQGLPLQPLQAQLVTIIEMHPEYHALLLDEVAVEQDFAGGNPFLHLALHAALHDQVATDRPRGITDIRQRLAARLGDGHAAEHRMIDVLMGTLAEAQRSGRAPEEPLYLERLSRL